ncbi:hypothetical protein FQN52_002282 [Onygenales sp. PD_12]|nr:hypothetical protein FQN52_002282 [Onygenales sp. PD_12]
MADSCWHQPSFVSSMSSIPFFNTASNSHTSHRRPAPNRILKTTSADNSPSRIAKRDMMSSHGLGQRRSVRNSIREQSFHSALLRTIPNQRPISSLSSPPLPTSAYPNTRPFTSWHEGGYQNTDRFTPPHYSSPNEFYAEQYVLNVNNSGSHLQPHAQFQQFHLNVSNRNSINVMETVSPAPPRDNTHYMATPTAYSVPYSTDTDTDSAAHTALSTPGILPIQQFQTNPMPSPIVPDRSEQGEELVGVGLYDEPEGFSLWDQPIPGYLGLGRDEDSLISLGRPEGKGLKLEETFDPSTIKESPDDDGEGEADDENDEDDEINRAIQTPEEPKPQIQPALEMMPRIEHNEPWLLAQHEESICQQLDMAGRSFFFETEQDSDLRFASSKPQQQPMAFPANMFGYGWI